MNKKINREGFTIIELLIVIVVIGILAALVLNTFQGIQSRARDTERQTDINSVHGQLEVYHTDNSEYPSTAEFVVGSFPGLDAEALVAPNAGEVYTYTPLQADGTTACAVAADTCASYTLSAEAENDQDDDGDVDANDLFSKTSLN